MIPHYAIAWITKLHPEYVITIHGWIYGKLHVYGFLKRTCYQTFHVWSFWEMTRQLTIPTRDNMKYVPFLSLPSFLSDIAWACGSQPWHLKTPPGDLQYAQEIKDPYRKRERNAIWCGAGSLKWALCTDREYARGRLNINIPSYQYLDPHVNYKTVSRPSYI